MNFAGWRGGRPGFTLIEVLVTIVLVSLLLVLLLPGLRGVRKSSWMTVSESRIRQHAVVFHQYTSDWRDFWPAVTVPDATYSVVYDDATPYYIRYFDANFFWSVPLARPVYGTTYRDDAIHSPAHPTERGYPSYRYDASFLADPDYWRPETRVGPSQWRATRAAEVLFPSDKSLFIDFDTNRVDLPEYTMRLGPPYILSFCDGSAGAFPGDKLARGYAGGTGPWGGTSSGSSMLPDGPGVMTIGGLRGRDRVP